MDITMNVTGRSGKPGRFFFIPKGALTHHRAAGPAVVSLPLVGPCALHEVPAWHFSRGGSQCRRMLLRHRLCGWQTATARFAPLLQSLVPIRDNLPPACENLPQAALSQRWTMLFRTVHFLLLAPKETKAPPCEAERM